MKIVIIQKNSAFFFDKNKKGNWENERWSSGNGNIKFIRLRSKTYTYEIDNKTTKKCKGKSKHTVNEDIIIDDYRETLFSSTKKTQKKNKQKKQKKTNKQKTTTKKKKTHSIKSIKSHNHMITSCKKKQNVAFLVLMIKDTFWKME